jgi:hypothetical protein
MNKGLHFGQRAGDLRVGIRACARPGAARAAPKAVGSEQTADRSQRELENA